jgi:hypothetical protein
VELLLQRFLILVVRAIFNDDRIIAFTDFAALLCLGRRLALCLFLKSWRGGRDRHILLQIVLQRQASINMTTSSNSVLGGSSHDY